MRPVRLLSAATVAVAAIGLTVAVPGVAAAAVPDGLPSAAAAQIDALSAAKEARTPAERKVSSQLLTAAVQQRGGRAAAGVGVLTTGVPIAKDGTVRVSITAAPKADVDDIAKSVVNARGAVRAIWKTTVDADVPLTAVTALAGSAAVAHIDPVDRATLAGADATPTHATVQQRTAAVTAAAGGVQPNAGSVDSEGDVALGADAARAKYRVGGTGVTVGVLSDGVDSLADSIASGDLPANTRVLDGQEGFGDEGTAMLEIVHDVAPRADLIFATAFESAEGFAQNIRDLRAAGADIIVDDIIYYAESPFQDGPIAQAVADVTADGAQYFSSAGNQGNYDDRTSGNWEGDFTSSGQTIGKFKGVANDFDPGTPVQAANALSDDSAGTVTTLFWADPLGAARDDYDLYVIDPAGDVVASSNTTQDGDDDPFEVLQVPTTAGPDLRIAVVKFRGADRYLQVTTFGGRFEANGGVKGFATPGVTRGHSAVKAAYSIAAVPAADPLPFAIKPGLANPAGPFPGRYTAAQKSEVFTSDGPRRVFFTAGGQPITPGNTTATGGEVRRKPDLTSADGVATNAPGFDPFFGTSAAAPHAAAVAALVIGGNPGISSGALRRALTSTATDIEIRGYDRDTGYGISLAPSVLASTGATSQPLVTAGTPVVSSGGDGDAYLEPGESAQVSIPLTNSGDGTAANVNITLTSTGDATVTPAVRQVGAIGVDATKNAVFTVAVPSAHPAGTPVELSATVRFTGRLSPTGTTLSIPIGQPAAPVAFRYTGPVVPIPDDVDAGVNVPVAVTGVGVLSGVTFSIDGTDCTSVTTVGIDHTFVGDLTGTLVAPDGTSVTLFSGIGGTGENFCQTVFDDAATTPIQSQTSAAAPFTGTYQPAQPLSGLVGVQGNGTWQFNVADTSTIDTGNVRAFSLRLAGYAG